MTLLRQLTFTEAAPNPYGQFLLSTQKRKKVAASTRAGLARISCGSSTAAKKTLHFASSVVTSEKILAALTEHSPQLGLTSYKKASESFRDHETSFAHF